MSLADCIAAGGDFQGVGTTECLNCGGQTGPQSHRCRPPFDECCCEEKTSKGAGLVFTAPRNKQRLPPFDAGSSKQFTIELKTESDIMIHGELFSAYSQCLTTIICHDEFNVEPVPCGSNFTNLWIKVCWHDHGYTREELPFPECQGLTIWLGNCGGTELQFCTTYTQYDGNGLTSDVDIILYGSAHITANGTGPLVITAPITNQGNCPRTLTIDGISPLLNSINGGITEAQGGEKMTLVKDGVGTWRLGASSSFEGQTLIKQGTLIAGVATGPSGSGVFGSGVTQATLPMVGDSSNDATGFAAMLLEDGVVINRSIQVAAPGANQIAILGGANTSGTSTFAYNTECRTGRSVTLQCATGDFGCVWLDSAGTGSPAISYTIGSVGNLGTVRLSNPLATTNGTVSINYGTLLLGFGNVSLPGAGDAIASTTPVFIGTSTSTGTLDIDGNSLALSSLTFIGSGSFVANAGAGVLTMMDGPNAANITVQSGTGHQISSNMVLASNTTVHVPLGATLLISGNISGAFTLTRTGCGTLTLTGTNTSTIVNIPC
jgi:autotransporter-associated beta strand protein